MSELIYLPPRRIDAEFRRTMRRLAAVENLRDVADSAKVNYNWLKNLRRGEILEPGWTKFEKVRHDLNKREAATKARSKRSEAASKQRAA